MTSLARIPHPPSAHSPDLRAGSALRSLGVLDDLIEVASALLGREAPTRPASPPNAPKAGEGSGLARAAAALALLALAGPVASQSRAARSEQPSEEAAGPSDRELERLWKSLSTEDKREVVEWFRQEARWLDTFQAGLLRYVLDGQERDPGTWPEAGPTPWFDPATHAPGGVVPRKPLAPSSSLVKKKRERFFSAVPEPRLASAWTYDYGARELRRTADPDDPERVFANALTGFAPDLDLARARVEMLLDDGSQRAVLAAFDHAYTDRDGKVYTGLTLYDAWCSGSEIEMPDVDCLGIVHDVLDDWRTWKAPVVDQDSLYDRIAELFQDARRHRGLRLALARCYLTGEPVLRDGYAASLDELHALWESASSTPGELAGRLPGPADWKRFLEDWAARCKKEPELLAAGRRRRATLEADGRAVRATFARVLTEFERGQK